MAKICIVGAGVSGLMTAIKLIDGGLKGEDITIIEKGNLIEKRKCFTNDNTACRKCRTCNLLCGIGGGGGAFNDGKLNLIDTQHPNSVKIGGTLIDYHTIKELEMLSDEMLNIYNRFGMKDMAIDFVGDNLNEIGKEVLEKMKDDKHFSIAENKMTHVGSDRSRIIYKNIQDWLLEKGVNFKLRSELTDLIIKNNNCLGVVVNNNEEIYADKVILCTGRYGNSLLGELINKHNIKKKSGSIDLGVRVEVPTHIMKPLESFYELKAYYKGSYNDEARVFCYNRERAWVVNEKYDIKGETFVTVNGHAFNSEDKRTNIDNFAILVKKEFNDSLEKPIDDYVLPMVKMMNALGEGGSICQTFYDLINHRRTTEESIKECSIKPTLKSYCGDLSNVLPYRILKTIIEMIYALDEYVPGIAQGNNTILHGVEVKLHSNGIKVENGNGKTSVNNLYALGDVTSLTRGVIQAGIMSLLCVKDILGK
jgi:uncharacterized FAD-dependent dehydrogenase